MRGNAEGEAHNSRSDRTGNEMTRAAAARHLVAPFPSAASYVVFGRRRIAGRKLAAAAKRGERPHWKLLAPSRTRIES